MQACNQFLDVDNCGSASDENGRILRIHKNLKHEQLLVSGRRKTTYWFIFIVGRIPKHPRNNIDVRNLKFRTINDGTRVGTRGSHVDFNPLKDEEGMEKGVWKMRRKISGWVRKKVKDVRGEKQSWGKSVWEVEKEDFLTSSAPS